MKISHNTAYCFLFIFLLAITAGCGDSEPIKIGFAGPLSGTLSDYGLASRRGVVLGIEEINAAGGINGRKIQLIVKDDQNDPAEALKVDNELAGEGVAAIIGHFTSTACIAVLDSMNKQGMLLISPGATSNKLSGKDDFFLRTIEADDDKAEGTAEYAFNTLGLKNAALVYDTVNRAYSESYARSFEHAFKALGGRTSMVVEFNSKEGLNAEQFAPIINSDCDCVLVVAGTVDTAVLVQELAKHGKKIPVLSSSWAMRQEFIENSGAAGEGTIFARSLDMNADVPQLGAFKKNFKNRFGEEAGGAAARGYDAVTALKVGLENTGDISSSGLKDAILKHKTIPALGGDFIINEHGDAERDFIIFTVRDGSFQPVE